MHAVWVFLTMHDWPRWAIALRNLVIFIVAGFQIVAWRRRRHG